MSREDSILHNTTFQEMARKTSFTYYHNVPPADTKIINHSQKVKDEDDRFLFNPTKHATKDFCFEGQFLRGCIRINQK